MNQGDFNMKITSGSLKMDERQQEIIQYYSRDFQYRNPEAILNAQRTVPWHWHRALEFVHVLTGGARFLLPQQEVLVPPDTILIINSEVSHAAVANDVNLPAQYHTHLVNPDLLSGGIGNFIKNKYFDPVMQCSALPFYLITPDMPVHAESVRLFEEAFTAADNHDELMELKVRQNLTQLWLIFIEATQEIWRNATPGNDLRSQRIKQMLSYIQENSTEKITLEDIAGSAGISTRECLRTFQTMLKMTPFEYLIDCRVRRAADLLLNSTDSILDIALACGFSSSSYFCRIFKKNTGHSPSDYKRAIT